MENNYRKQLLILLISSACSVLSYGASEGIAVDQRCAQRHYEKAYVRHDAAMSLDEVKFLGKRSEVTADALRERLRIDIDDGAEPRIALCLSGGGVRAAVTALATLLVFDELGLFDMLTYVAGLSGSSWPLACLYGFRCSLPDLKEFFKKRLKKPFLSVSLAAQLGLDHFVRWRNGPERNLVQVWGSCLAKRFFCNRDGDKLPRLSSFVQSCDTGHYPLPIFTAVSAQKHRLHEWVEFTPYEVRGLEAQVAVPAWAFGRPFNAGVSTDSQNEPGLDYYLGIWSSAFSVSAQEFLRHYPSNRSGFIGVLSSFAAQEQLRDIRLSRAELNNFACGMGDHSWSRYQKLTLIDAGIACNLPVAPLLFSQYRVVDLMIIVDASAHLEGAPQLRIAEQYARKHNQKFPPIDYTDIEKRPLSVFKADGCPTVLYMPLIKNEVSQFDPARSIRKGGFCATHNMVYTEKQFNKLFDLVSANIMMASPDIFDEIREVVHKK